MNPDSFLLNFLAQLNSQLLHRVCVICSEHISELPCGNL